MTAKEGEFEKKTFRVYLENRHTESKTRKLESRYAKAKDHQRNGSRQPELLQRL